jgi:hypothetical protein
MGRGARRTLAFGDACLVDRQRRGHLRHQHRASEVAAEKYRNYLANEFQQWVMSRQSPTTQGRLNWTTTDYQRGR